MDRKIILRNYYIGGIIIIILISISFLIGINYTDKLDNSNYVEDQYEFNEKRNTTIDNKNDTTNNNNNNINDNINNDYNNSNSYNNRNNNKTQDRGYHFTEPVDEIVLVENDDFANSISVPSGYRIVDYNSKQIQDLFGNLDTWRGSDGGNICKKLNLQ